jgi:glyoxylase-like metal-dependent hydrolase (beta-lactamase superfamily II)
MLEIKSYFHGDFNVIQAITHENWNQNGYILSQTSTNQAFIIDPGFDSKFFIDLINKKGLNPMGILLTHAHFDHVGAVTDIAEYFKIKAFVNKLDFRLIKHSPMYALRMANIKIKIPEPVTVYENEIEFIIGEKIINIINTPGHTMGSVCYCIDNIAFTGDTLLFKRIGRTDLPGGNIDILFNSLKKILYSLSEDTIIYCGHGQIWNVGEAQKWFNESKESYSQHKSFEKF